MLDWVVVVASFIGNWLLRFLAFRLEDFRVVPPEGALKDEESKALVHCIFTVTGDYYGQDQAYEDILRIYRLSRKDLLMYLKTLHDDLVRHEKRAMRRAHIIGMLVWAVLMGHTYMAEGRRAILPVFLSYYIGLALAAVSPYVGYSGIVRYYRQVVKSSFFVVA